MIESRHPNEVDLNVILLKKLGGDNPSLCSRNLMTSQHQSSAKGKSKAGQGGELVILLPYTHRNKDIASLQPNGFESSRKASGVLDDVHHIVGNPLVTFPVIHEGIWGITDTLNARW